MPRYARRRTFKRRRSYKRAASRRRRRIYKKRRFTRRRKPILSGIPNSKLVKLRYVEHVTLNSDNFADSIIEHRFRANSIFDPNLTAAGHQPMGSDQWAQFYQYYCVIGAKFTARYVPTSATNGTPGYFGAQTTTYTGSLNSFYTGNVDNLLEDKKTGKYNCIVGNAQGLPGPNSISRIFSAKKTFAKSNVIDDSDLSATFSINPVE